MKSPFTQPGEHPLQPSTRVIPRILVLLAKLYATRVSPPNPVNQPVTNLLMRPAYFISNKLSAITTIPPTKPSRLSCPLP